MNTQLFLALPMVLLLTGRCDDWEPPRDSGAPDSAMDAGVDAADATPDASIDTSEDSCGNEICEEGNNEDCATCPIDCGSCPIQWTRLAPGEEVSLEAAHFPINAAVGFAVGLAGSAIKTVNGGADWTALDSETANALRSVDFVDEETGYAAGDAGTIIKTVDGATWTPLTAVTNVALRGVDFVTALWGVVVGGGGTILATTDGGDTWDPQVSNTTETLHGVHFLDTQIGFVVGASGTVLKTVNGGTSWTALPPVTSQTLRDVAFSPDGRIGFAVGDAGTIIRSPDGGDSWLVQSSGTTRNLWAVDLPLDGQHAHTVGDGGTILRTIDSGTLWQREDAGGDDDLRGVVFPAYWTIGYAVGTGSTVVKRVPEWGATVVYDMEVAALAPPSILVNADPMQRVIFIINSHGRLFAIRPGDRIALYKPLLLEGSAPGRGPVGTLPGEDDPSIFIGTTNGLGYAIDALSGIARWTTDGDATTPGTQPLGDSLVAAPTIVGPLNLAFFGTHNDPGQQNRLFAFNAKTGSCEWVFNGDCNGGVSTLGVGRIGGAPAYDALANRLYVATTSLDSGDTAWAVDASEGSQGLVVWSRNLGGSTATPAFAALDLQSIYVGTINGRVYRLRGSDGGSCWTTGGTGCDDASGDEQVFCAATDTVVTTCAAGSEVVNIRTIFSGAHTGRMVFLTADGHLRMIGQDGQLVWKTAQPITGASSPLVATSEEAIYVNSVDGNLRQLSLATGAVTATQQVGDGRAVVGSPAYDSLGQTIYVGTGFGELHSFSLPLAQ